MYAMIFSVSPNNIFFSLIAAIVLTLFIFKVLNAEETPADSG